eukprot:CAMPEP_0114232374 /NCGR_PEP_ID=MMETSP0058-20121206/4570_1 /TAXON_ID=36894 /ORGANISM="Pyramimonas parkeae, CCMP726" /LENGTH=193 /DNA_ID=CAMNT_0001343839 /DNA_START=210 /DNA_END=791 /DNA_ORIENTATION=-
MAAKTEASVSGRRALLTGLGGLTATLGLVSNSSAIPIGLPGEAIVVCDPGEEGLECRREELAKDAGKRGNADYDQYSSRDKGRTSVAKSSSNEGYEEATRELIEVVESYMVLTPFDKKRPALVAQIQKEGNAWVGKYAPGGSSKKESGRDFYNALNQLLGHIAFNGLAPMRPALVAQIQNNMDATKALLDQGK